MGWFAFGWGSKAKLAQIDRDLCSAVRDTRTSAILELFKLVKKNPRTHAAALPMLSRVAQSEQDPWIAGVAARGIEHISGPIAAREVWLRLLASPDSAMVTGIVAQIGDLFYAPILRKMLQEKTHPDSAGVALYTLGRLQDPEALPLLLEYLARPEYRGSALQGLADLGDPRAIPHIEPYLNDMTECPQRDERGCVIHIADVAGFAIRRINFIVESKANPDEA